MTHSTLPIGRLAAALLTAVILSGCANVISKNQTLTPEFEAEEILPPKAREIVEEAKAARAAPPMIDNVAPEVFQATDLALWDGKPTFGDRWIIVAGATQPERVEITNEETGRTVRASMLVDEEGMAPDAPMKLSSGAAEALGIAPLQSVRVTVTAIRMTPLYEEASVVLPSPQSPVSLAPPAMELAGYLPVAPAPSIDGFAPALNPAPVEGGYIEVAQAYDPDDASRIYEELQAKAIPSELQQDYLRGENVYRVFASTQTRAETLFSALDDIRYATGAEGSDTGTLIAEMPDFLNLKEAEPAAWIEMGVFASRNEAMSVVQKLSRTEVPTEICHQRHGLLTTYRVFAGPAETVIGPVEPSIQTMMTDAFCRGVAATDASRPLTAPEFASAPELLPLPEASEPIKATIPEGAVRIRVGESTGDLNIRVPNPYSEPVQIPVQGVMVSIPTNATPELVGQIRRALQSIQ